MSAVIELTRVELICALRHLRTRREAIYADLMHVQERIRSVGDGERDALQGAALVLDGELKVLDDIIRKLWPRVTPTDEHLARREPPPRPPRKTK